MLARAGIRKTKFSGAEIATPTLSVYAVDGHTISCELKDIPGQYTGVSWSPTGGSTPADGVFDTDSQTATLKITSAKLSQLHSSSPTQTFTCKIIVGISQKAVTATQTITVYKPSE